MDSSGLAKGLLYDALQIADGKAVEELSKEKRIRAGL